jgi:hypothetical protein
MVLGGVVDALYGMPGARIAPRERFHLTSPRMRGEGSPGITMRERAQQIFAVAEYSAFTGPC